MADETGLATKGDKSVEIDSEITLVSLGVALKSHGETMRAKPLLEAGLQSSVSWATPVTSRSHS